MKVVARIHAWMDGRTRRERILLAVCVGLLAIVASWVFVYRPLEAWRDRAADTRFAALAEERAVAAAVARSEPETARPDDGPITPRVEQAATDLGLSPNLAMAANGDLGFTASSLPVGAAFAWLTALEAQGLRITALSVVENTDSTVTIEGAISHSR